MIGVLDYLVEGRIEDMIANLLGKGVGRDIAKVARVELSAPEAAKWEAGQRQLVLLRSGNDLWMELRFNRLPLRQVWERRDFPQAVVEFVQNTGK